MYTNKCNWFASLNCKVICALFFSFFYWGSAFAEKSSEANEKAVVLKRIAGWVAWPLKPGEVKNDISICLLGAFSSANDFTRMNDQTVNDKKLKVRLISTTEEAEKGCDIVYLANPKEEQAKKLINTFSTKQVLTISDVENFAKSGGSMNFTRVNDKLAVTINLENMGKVGLSLSPNAYKRLTLFPDDKELR